MNDGDEISIDIPNMVMDYSDTFKRYEFAYWTIEGDIYGRKLCNPSSESYNCEKELSFGNMQNVVLVANWVSHTPHHVQSCADSSGQWTGVDCDCSVAGTGAYKHIMAYCAIDVTNECPNPNPSEFSITPIGSHENYAFIGGRIISITYADLSKEDCCLGTWALYR